MSKEYYSVVVSQWLPQSVYNKITCACGSYLTSTGALILQKKKSWFTKTLGTILFIDMTDL